MIPLNESTIITDLIASGQITIGCEHLPPMHLRPQRPRLMPMTSHDLHLLAMAELEEIAIEERILDAIEGDEGEVLL
jgi:hypothetical protein